MGSGLNGDSCGTKLGSWEEREREKERVREKNERERERKRELEAKVSRGNEAIEGRIGTKRNCVELVP